MFGHRPFSTTPFSTLPAAARTFSYVASGGIEYAGAAAVYKTKAFEATGGIEYAGAATVSKTKSYEATGGIEYGGAASVAKTKAFTPAGGIEYAGAADLKKTKAFTASGGILYAGEAAYQFIDVDVYVASGGILYDGAAVVAFVQSAQPQPDAPQGHGRGPFQLRSPSLRLAIRQYGDPVSFQYRASGGIRYGGEADYQLVRFTVTYAPRASAAVLKFSGKAIARRFNDDDDYLALAA